MSGVRSATVIPHGVAFMNIIDESSTSAVRDGSQLHSALLLATCGPLQDGITAYVATGSGLHYQVEYILVNGQAQRALGANNSKVMMTLTPWYQGTNNVKIRFSSGAFVMHPWTLLLVQPWWLEFRPEEKEEGIKRDMKKEESETECPSTIEID